MRSTVTFSIVQGCTICCIFCQAFLFLPFMIFLRSLMVTSSNFNHVDTRCPEVFCSTRITLSRGVWVRDLIKWCTRMVCHSPLTSEGMFSEAYDCFVAAQASPSVRMQVHSCFKNEMISLAPFFSYIKHAKPM